VRVRHLSGAQQGSSRISAVIYSARIRHLLWAREGSSDLTRGIYPARVTHLVGPVQGTTPTGEGNYLVGIRHLRIGREASCRSTRPIESIHVTHLVDRRDPSSRTTSADLSLDLLVPERLARPFFRTQTYALGRKWFDDRRPGLRDAPLQKDDGRLQTRVRVDVRA
jgi:hypothetical protein